MIKTNPINQIPKQTGKDDVGRSVHLQNSDTPNPLFFYKVVP